MVNAISDRWTTRNCSYKISNFLSISSPYDTWDEVDSMEISIPNLWEKNKYLECNTATPMGLFLTQNQHDKMYGQLKKLSRTQHMRPTLTDNNNRFINHTISYTAKQLCYKQQSEHKHDDHSQGMVKSLDISSRLHHSYHVVLPISSTFLSLLIAFHCKMFTMT